MSRARAAVGPPLAAELENEAAIRARERAGLPRSPDWIPPPGAKWSLTPGARSPILAPMTRGIEARAWTPALAILGALMFANALWMLAGPMHWYRELPAAVPDTGPFNPHFVRDIGCAFLTVGAALLWAARAPRWRPPLVAMSALFLGAHAVLHVYDTLRGALGHDHWWLDLPGVYLPALVLAWAAVVFLRPRAS